MTKAILTTAALLLSAMPAFAQTKPLSPPKLLTEGTTAPDFTVQDKSGKPVKLSDYKGKTVILDFWATFCTPCMWTFPHTAALAKTYADKNVVVLAVNIWDTPVAFHAWMPKHPQYSAWTFAIDPNPNQDKNVGVTLYGIPSVPAVYVIGPDGKIVKGIVGYKPNDPQLADALKTATSGTGN